MAVSWEFIDALAAEFPDCVANHGKTRAWDLRGKTIAWERSLSQKDLKAMGERAPKGRVLAVHTVHLMARDTWIQTVPGACFVSPHFDSYPAVLVDLEMADEQLVREVFAEGYEAVKAKLTS